MLCYAATFRSSESLLIGTSYSSIPMRYYSRTTDLSPHLTCPTPVYMLASKTRLYQLVPSYCARRGICQAHQKTAGPLSGPKRQQGRRRPALETSITPLVSTVHNYTSNDGDLYQKKTDRAWRNGYSNSSTAILGFSASGYGRRLMSGTKS